MLELRNHSFANMLRLLFVLCLVPRNSSENRDSAPLGAFAERDQQSREGLRVEDEDGLVFGGLLDLRQRSDSVRDNL